MGWVEGVAWVVSQPLGGDVCRDYPWYPSIASGTSEVAVGFWPFMSYHSYFAPAEHSCSYLVSYSYFVI